jgi:hypothetical protein
MVETRLTPAHTNPLKTLLNKPLTSTFNHARPKGELLLVKTLIVNMTVMALKIGLNLDKGIQGLTGE